MKTRSKLSLIVLAFIVISAIACKGKSNSSSGSDIVASSKGNSVMDSLNITDSDEKKVCALYDDAITDYIKEFKTVLTDTSKAAIGRREELDKKWKEKEKEIQPQVEALRNKVATVPGEAAKFAQFSAYESRRLMSVIADYQKVMMKSIQSGSQPNK